MNYLTLKSLLCVVVATINKIKPEQGWYYLACRKCNSKAVETEKSHLESDTDNHPAPFQCVKCKGVSDVYNRIKMQIQVKDNTGTVSFWLFQREVTKLINKSASYLLDKINKDEECKMFPDELETMLEKRCAFKIKISSFNVDKNYHTYTVDIINDDPDIIKAVMEKSSHSQGKNSSITELKRKIDSDEDEPVIISSKLNSAQEVPKLKIPKVEKE